MNKRMKELAEQAGFFVANDMVFIPTTDENITNCAAKFAELIVEECARSVLVASKRLQRELGETVLAEAVVDTMDSAVCLVRTTFGGQK